MVVTVRERRAGKRAEPGGRRRERGRAAQELAPPETGTHVVLPLSRRRAVVRGVVRGRGEPPAALDVAGEERLALRGRGAPRRGLLAAQCGGHPVLERRHARGMPVKRGSKSPARL